MRVGRLVLAAIAGLVFFSGTAGAEEQLPAGPNVELVYGRCRTCHDLQYLFESAGITHDNWVALIDDMGRYGMRIPAEEREKIVKYLVTYFGPNPPKDAPKTATKAVADGKTLYAQQCSSCHQAQGTGIPRTFPPLASNPDLYANQLFPVYVVLNGLEGPATIKGEKYSGVMPSFNHLSDAEIAAVVAYVRSAWGNAKLRPAGFVEADPEAVGKARKKPISPKEVHAYRTAQR